MSGSLQISIYDGCKNVVTYTLCIVTSEKWISYKLNKVKNTVTIVNLLAPMPLHISHSPNPKERGSTL